MREGGALMSEQYERGFQYCRIIGGGFNTVEL